VLPTEDGDYTWHIFGKIEDTPVDVSMTSSPDTFGAVEAKAEVSFPAAEATTMSLSQQVSDTARLTQVSLIVGGAGLVLGIVGLVVGAVGLRAARRKTM
jgi:hypothetical protein